MIEVTTSPDKTQWCEFVLNHTHGNIFQTPEMAEVYRRTKNYEPVTLAAVDTKGDEMLAVLQAVVIKELSGVLGSFSARAIIQGGPLFVDTENGIEALELLMAHYDKIAQKKALYTQIRTMWDTSNISGILNTLGYEYEERLNFLIDLNRPEEEIWRDIHKSRREGINRAANKWVVIE
jgi:lipid II:glycine glycyltransferase (peptidoglycan interpeptide bridge formation enzyme)